MADVALGIDLAWTDGKTSGLCFMERTPRGWDLQEAIAETWSNEKIVDWVLRHSAGTTVVAIDAPLWIPNPTGTRDCDRTVASEYWKYLIGVYPCN